LKHTEREEDINTDRKLAWK